MITDYKIQNYRNHDDTQGSLKKVNWALGAAESGKTSFLAALEYSMCGVIHSDRPWTDEKGAGAKYGVGPRAKKSAFSFLASEGNFAATIPGGPQGAILDKYLTRACLHQGAFFMMHPDEQQKLLFSILDIGYDTFDELNAWSDKFPGIGDWFAEKLDSEKEWTPKELEEFAIEERKASKRKLEDLKKQRPVPIPEFQKNVTQKDIEKAQAQYEEALEKHANAKAEAHANEGQEDSKLIAWESLKFQRDQVSEGLKEAEEEVTALTLAMGADPQEQLNKAIEEKSFIEKKMKIPQAEMDTVMGDKNKCPAGKCAKEVMKACQDVLDKHRADEKVIEARINELKQAVHGRLMNKQKLEAAQQRWARCKDNLSKLPERGVKPEPAAKKVTKKKDGPTLEQLKEQMEMFKRTSEIVMKEYLEAQRVLGAIQANEKREAGLIEYQEMVKQWEVITEALSPGGIRAQHVTKALKPLEDVLNSEDGLGFFDMKVAFQVEPFEILVTNRKGITMPAYTLCQTQLSAASIPFQVMFATRKSFPLVALDEHGADSPWRNLIFQYLKRQDIQSIVFSQVTQFNEDGSPVLPPAPDKSEDIQIMFFDDGNVMTLEAADAVVTVAG